MKVFSEEEALPAVCTLDPEGRVTGWNARAERLYGYGADEIVGQHFSSLCRSSGGADDFLDGALVAAERYGYYEAAAEHVHKDGSRFNARILLQPLRDGSGRLIGYVEMLDRIERSDLAQRLNEMRESSRAIGHDYNNALFSVMGGLELLRRNIGDNDVVAAEMFHLVKQYVDQAASLTQRLLEASERLEPDRDWRALGALQPVRGGASTAGGSEGLRVLIVEDEALVRMLIEDYLDQLECRLVGSASSLDKALEMAARNDIDLALLDLNLGGERVDRVAALLQERGIPFVFISGYDAIPEYWRSRPSIAKPFELEHLRRAIELATAAHPAA